MPLPKDHYVDPSINANSGTGTIGDPFGDLQYALNSIPTIGGGRGADGDRINIKSGTQEVLTGAISYTTFGTSGTQALSVEFRGYNSVAQDGGVAVINCNGLGSFPNRNYTHFTDLEIKTPPVGTSAVILGIGGSMYRCKVSLDGHSAGHGLSTSSAAAAWIRCHIEGAGGSGQSLVNLGSTGATLLECFLDTGTGTWSDGAVTTGIALSLSIVNCVIKCGHANTIAIKDTGASHFLIMNNSLYNSNAVGSPGTSNAISVEDTNTTAGEIVLNNIIVGWTGTGVDTGNPLRYTSTNAHSLVMNSLFYNNRQNVVYATEDPPFLQENNVVGTMMPFVDPNNNDFRLTSEALALPGVTKQMLGALSINGMELGASQSGPSVGAPPGVTRAVAF